jgi:hypothetical protein
MTSSVVGKMTKFSSMSISSLSPPFMLRESAKVTARVVGARNLVGVRGSLSVAQASGSILTVDINKNGTTVLSTKLTFNNTEKTTVTAATPAVISVASFADDDEVSVDIDALGGGTAKGLKVSLLWG